MAIAEGTSQKKGEGEGGGLKEGLNELYCGMTNNAGVGLYKELSCWADDAHFISDCRWCVLLQHRVCVLPGQAV